ncbi:MAG TPA: flavin reductase family protein [Candidatus Acidoferrales bacterium]|nr:flavin reductase family protein [Candidatus Acidoferrales bacterium]
MEIIPQDEAFALSAPMIYTLVTSVDKNGKPNALGVSWVTRTSFNPFLLMISIDHTRYSHEGIRLHKEFVVNYPNEDQTDGAWICGSKSGRDTDKIKDAGLSLIDSIAVKVPTIDGVTVAFECKVIGQFETGDHTVFVGEVVATRGDLSKVKHLYVTSDYKFFSLGGSQPPH